MMLGSKHQDAVKSSAFDQDETELKTKIEEVKNVADPFERLLQYNALKEAAEKAYDESKANLPSREADINNAAGAGAAVGVGIGVFAGPVAGALLAASVLSGGALFVAGLLIAAGVMIAGGFAGHKIAKNIARRKFLSPEEKHAMKLLEMSRGLGAAIELLENSLKERSSLAALAQSKYFKEVMKASPAIATAFNGAAEKFDQYAKIAAKQKASQAQTHKPPKQAKAPPHCAYKKSL